MLRSILSIIAGYFLVVVLSVGTDFIVMYAFPKIMDSQGATQNPALLVATLIYTTLYAFAGAFLTATLARRNPVLHACILGGIALLISLLIVAETWNSEPAWYNVASLLIIMPACWLAGILRSRIIM